MQDIFAFFQATIAHPSLRIAPFYLPGMIILAYWVWRKQRETGSFWRWLFPRDIYFHRSHLVDIQLFAVGRILTLLGAFQKVAVTVAIASLIVGFAGGTVTEPATLSPVWIALIVLLANDFTVYWVHRVHHEHPTLWPFHAVHHSAEVMTPITVYRKHPIYDLISSTAKGVILGVAQGVLLSFLVTDLSVALIAGVNVFYFAFNAVTANLRHSHVWLSFGRRWEHIFISPAQHQVHHSSELRHYNKNYGEVLAIWDWMFGTLYLTSDREDLRFGIGDAEGNRVAQPHPTLMTALIEPIQSSLATLRPARSKAARREDAVSGAPTPPAQDAAQKAARRADAVPGGATTIHPAE
ncbi:sterol desaturase family protein [Cognatishimia sp. F0-27]|uniref:sterol desaturase family protein n=1 Tax=Cognatishimia sp. F0-27 TaxID=2816855 RepID=UPI001D0C9B63|nr:sterol desaturase family protein [Cognatishimia sp. F0-27]MCC1491361.1 sterol desaturase family protein [Cognatishimia sp. F0-27]